MDLLKKKETGTAAEEKEGREIAEVVVITARQTKTKTGGKEKGNGRSEKYVAFLRQFWVKNVAEHHRECLNQFTALHQ